MTVSIRWLGHSGFQIRSEASVVYVDYYRPSELAKRVAEPTEKATLVLVTHSHDDHCHSEAIARIIGPDTVIAGPEDCAKKTGLRFTAMRPGESLFVKNISVRAVHAYNVKRFRSPGKPFHPKGFGVGYVITIDDKSIYHAGDTDLIPEMSELKDIDVALLPVGDTYTMDNAEAVEAVRTINPRVAIPMHTWDKGVDVFKSGVSGIKGVNLVVLREGQEYTIV
ncbi:MAG: MBL fold metallo-hydrolase [Candidatus Thorarchaeota archaeon]